MINNNFKFINNYKINIGISYIYYIFFKYYIFIFKLFYNSNFNKNTKIFKK